MGCACGLLASVFIGREEGIHKDSTPGIKMIMVSKKTFTLTLGVDSNRVHYEVFGPHEVF